MDVYVFLAITLFPDEEIFFKNLKKKPKRAILSVQS